MKKQHIGLCIISNTWGGAEASMLQVMRTIDRNAFEITLLTNDFLYERYDELEGVRKVNLGTWESERAVVKIGSAAKLYVRLRIALWRHGISLVHARLENALLVFLIGGMRLGVPIIFTLSGDETRMYTEPHSLEQWLVQRAMQILLNHATHRVTSVSHWLIRDLPQVVQQKIAITHNGIDTAFFKPIAGAVSPEKTILYVGRLVAKKGIEDLVAVAAELPGYMFLFAGKGPLESLLTLENTKPLGFIAKEALPDLYAQTTLCAFPSYAEGMPNVGLEAMACGKTLVASRVGFSEFVTDQKDGIIIEPGDRAALRDGIVALVEDHVKREAYATVALQTARAFDITKTVKAYEQLYLSVIS